MINLNLKLQIITKRTIYTGVKVAAIISMIGMISLVNVTQRVQAGSGNTGSGSGSSAPNNSGVQAGDPNLAYRIFLPIVASVIIPPSQYSNGKTYYVSVAGSDAVPGSLERPWRTIQKAANTLTAGDIVYIRAGVYHEKVTPKNSGAAQKYITYAAFPGETPVIDGTGVALTPDNYQGDGLIFILGKSYLVFDGLTIRNSSANGINLYRYTDMGHNDYAGNVILSHLSIQNSHSNGILGRFTRHMQVMNNVIDRVDYSSGIGFWDLEDVLVDGNTITNARYYHEKQGADEEVLTISSVTTFEVVNNTIDFTLPNPWDANDTSFYNDRIGICIKDSSMNGRVDKNTVKHMNAVGIYIDPENSVTLSHVDVYQNRTIDGAGIMVGAEVSGGMVEYINIYNNVVLNASYSGIQVTGSHGDGMRKNIKIYNNTVYGALVADGNGGAGINITTENLGTNNGDKPVIIENNIVMFDYPTQPHACVGQIVAKDQVIAGLVNASHNLVYGPYCLNYLATWCPECREIGDRVVADPAAVMNNPSNDPSAYDFHLKSDSPAVDDGATTTIVATDYDGLSRPQGAAFDIGAFELPGGK